MKICSLILSGTEMLFALGLGDQVIGVTQYCNYPPEAPIQGLALGLGLKYWLGLINPGIFAGIIPRGTVQPFAATAVSVP